MVYFAAFMPLLNFLGRNAASNIRSFFFLLGSPVVGVGFTGSLATMRPKLGDHRYVFVV